MTPERRKAIKHRLGRCRSQQARNSYLAALSNDEYVAMIYDQEPPRVNCLIPTLLICGVVVLLAVVVTIIISNIG